METLVKELENIIPTLTGGVVDIELTAYAHGVNDSIVIARRYEDKVAKLKRVLEELKFCFGTLDGKPHSGYTYEHSLINDALKD